MSVLNLNEVEKLILSKVYKIANCKLESDEDRYLKFEGVDWHDTNDAINSLIDKGLIIKKRNNDIFITTYGTAAVKVLLEEYDLQDAKDAAFAENKKKNWSC